MSAIERPKSDIQDIWMASAHHVFGLKWPKKNKQKNPTHYVEHSPSFISVCLHSSLSKIILGPCIEDGGKKLWQKVDLEHILSTFKHSAKIPNYFNCWSAIIRAPLCVKQTETRLRARVGKFQGENICSKVNLDHILTIIKHSCFVEFHDFDSLAGNNHATLHKATEWRHWQQWANAKTKISPKDQRWLAT